VKAFRVISFVAVLLGAGFIAVAWFIYNGQHAAIPRSHGGNDMGHEVLTSPEYAFGTEIVGLPEQPMILTDAVDFHGNPVSVTCSTCHSTREGNLGNKTAWDLDQFHQGLNYRHGNLTCLSCHHEDNYDQLRFSDGRAIEYSEVMQLCAQCHGPQFRDYQAGSHGGMSGYWDLNKGERVRNACVVCHDPHAPAYPLLQPVFKPKDLPVTSVHP